MKRETLRMIIPHVLLAVLSAIVLTAPKAKVNVHGPWAMMTAVGIIEALFIFFALRNRKRSGTFGSGPSDIVSLVWLFMIVWEIFTSVLDLAHPVLVPAPENVFYVFADQWKTILLNISYSMRLLIGGMALGLGGAIILGLFCGWNKRLKAFSYPIANVLAPIPAIVISPYLVAIMPTFRSASLVVVFLGVFWPQFLGIINRISAIEPEILDSARMMKLSQPVMLFRIILPYIIPGILTGLKVTMTTSVLMLNFAELMGVTHGMGYYIQNSIVYANYTRAVAGIIVIGVVVTILGSIVGWIQKRFIKWH